ncbi:hypothetical protein AAFF_G00007680 [Aldrovandia affinis]|uniref:Uncharacterized protein n=1 Tax=Aldrovandia affinis TaxID=143900 RepID=A0AAD7T662_9TELE|nr:hypothetical protein AAFF_G00007680 [Aldrovandia affinis]
MTGLKFTRIVRALHLSSSVEDAANEQSIRWIRKDSVLFVQWRDKRDVFLCSTLHTAHGEDTKDIAKAKGRVPLHQKAFRETLVKELAGVGSHFTARPVPPPAPRGAHHRPVHISGDSTAGQLSLSLQSMVMTGLKFTRIVRALHLSSSVEDAANEQRRGTAALVVSSKIKPLYEEIREACKRNYHPRQTIATLAKE